MVALLFHRLEDVLDKKRSGSRSGSKDIGRTQTHGTLLPSIADLATVLHFEQLCGKITVVSYQFRETAGRDASSAQLYRYVFVCGVRLVSVRRASVPQGA